jgi:hypothetical protein
MERTEHGKPYGNDGRGPLDVARIDEIRSRHGALAPVLDERRMGLWGAGGRGERRKLELALTASLPLVSPRTQRDRSGRRAPMGVVLRQR